MTPTDEAFATVLTYALERDAGADEEDDDEDDLSPAPFIPSGNKVSPEKRPAVEGSDDVSLPQPTDGKYSGDEADKLIEAGDQDTE